MFPGRLGGAAVSPVEDIGSNAALLWQVEGARPGLGEGWPEISDDLWGHCPRRDFTWNSWRQPLAPEVCPLRRLARKVQAPGLRSLLEDRLRGAGGFRGGQTLPTTAEPCENRI